MIKVGDKVKFLSDTNEGVVLKIKGSIAYVEVEDGFEIPATLDDLVAVAKEEELRAISMIGVSDPKPGRVVKKGGQKSEEKEPRSRYGASLRYGKVSMVEDDEAPIDIYALKQQYRRTVTEVNRRALEDDKKQQEAMYSSTMPQVEEVAEPQPVEQPKPQPKAQKVTMEQLAESAGIKPEQPKQEKKSGDDGIEVIDLHAHEILDSTEGMTPGEIITAQISRFTIALDCAVKSGKHGKIVFIHGVGKGKLKYEITKILGRSYPKLAHQDASFREYGYGAIMIFY